MEDKISDVVQSVVGVVLGLVVGALGSIVCLFIFLKFLGLA